MGIDDDAFVQVVGVAENDVGGFSAHAGELHEVFHGSGNLTVVMIDEGLAAGFDVAGFIAVEAG